VTQQQGAPQDPREPVSTRSATAMDSSRDGLERVLSFVGTIVAVLGAVKLPALHGLALVFGIIAVICGLLSVIAAITSLVIGSGVFVARVTKVTAFRDAHEAWEMHKGLVAAKRAYLTRVSLYLLSATILSGGVALVISIVAPRIGGPAITVTQAIQSGSNAAETSITVKVGVQGVAATDHLSVTVTRQGTALGRAVVTPAADGSATATITIDHIAVFQSVVIDEFTSTQHCQAFLGPAAVATVRCQTR